MGPVTASNHPEHSQLHRLYWGSLLETTLLLYSDPTHPSISVHLFILYSLRDWPTSILFFSEYSESLQFSLNESINLHCLIDCHVGNFYDYLTFCVFSCFLILDISPSRLAHTAAAAKSLQSCPTLCDPIDGSPPGSPVPGILQARTLEWVAISFSNAWNWKVKVNSLSRVWPSATPWTAAYQAQQGSKNIQSKTVGVLLTLSKELDTTEQLSPH